MKTPQLHPDLKEFLLCLRGHDVVFVVIGAHVLATLGRPRYTGDIDVLVQPTKANAKRLARALGEFGYPELAARAAEHFAVEERMARLGHPPVGIDILTSSTGISFSEAWRGRQTIRIGGKAIAFLGLAEYVKTKRACGRTKDLLDLALLEEAGLLRAEKAKKPSRRPGASRVRARPSPRRRS
jgi:hypothetical protein